MMDTLKPYPEYKDSGLPWLGCIPKNWDIIRTKGLFQLSIEKSGSHHRMELLSIYTHIGVKPRKDLEERGNKASNTNGYWIVRKGDLIVNKLLAWMGAVGVSHYEGVTSPAYDILRPRKSLNSNFYHYLFRTKTYLQQFKARSRGIMDMRLRLYFDQLGQIPSVVPPKIDQDTIVNYLRVLDLKVNCFIRNRRRLIEVLNEQKQAIINRAVTRGLDPDAPLKPSGIDWLGNIPEHWKCARVKQCAKTISKGTTPSTEGKEILSSGPIRFIKAENIVDGRITDAPAFFIDEDTNRSLKRSVLFKNDILFVIAGATIGKTAIVQSCNLPVNTNQAVAFIRPNKSVNPRFLELWLQTSFVKEMIWLDAVQAAQPNLSMADLGNFVVPMTTNDEQHAIVKRTELDTLEIDNTIRIAQREINLILEYRTRLISDVVTGKADVRHLTPPPGSEDLEEALEPLEHVIDDVEMDEEEEVNESD